MSNLNKKFRFRNFPIYKDARKFNVEIITLTNKFPKSEKFCFLSQLYRAINSVKDFAHFLNNSHTSVNEIVACLDTALDKKYILKNEHKTFLQKAELLANQLTAFRKLLPNKNHQGSNVKN